MPNAVPLAGAGAVVRTGTESDALTIGAVECETDCDGWVGCEELAACCVTGAAAGAFLATCFGGGFCPGVLAAGVAGALAL